MKTSYHLDEKVIEVPEFPVVSNQENVEYILRFVHIRGLVPVTSPCNKLRGQVPSCELAILASKSSGRYQTLVPETTCTCSSKNSNQLNFWDKF